MRSAVVERWSRPSPTHAANHSNVRRLQRRAVTRSTRRFPAHHGPVQCVLGRRRLGHPPQQGHVPTRRAEVPDHGRMNKQDHMESQGLGCLWTSAQTRRSQDSHILHGKVVARKRDAATSLLQRLCAHIFLFDVDFVGGDFYMAAKGTVADMFSDPEFKAPGTTPLWGAGGLEGALVVLKEQCGLHGVSTHATPTVPLAHPHTRGPHILQRPIGPRRERHRHTPPGLHAPLGDQSPG